METAAAAAMEEGLKKCPLLTPPSARRKPRPARGEIRSHSQRSRRRGANKAAEAKERKTKENTKT